MEAPLDRMALARTICASLAAAHGDGVLLGGVYGSVARGDDTPWSDLEMLFVTRDGNGLRGRDLLYRGTAVHYEVLEKGVLAASLRQPSLRWPYLMGVLSGLRVLHGDEHLPLDWLNVGLSVPRDALRASLAGLAPGLVVESHGRMHSCVARGNTDALHVSAIEVLLEMRTALCLLNGRWVTHDYLEGILQAGGFPLVPDDYARLAADLWREHDPARAVALSDALVAAYWRLLAREGVPVHDAQSLDKLLA